MLCGTRSFSDVDEGSRAPSSRPRPRLSKLKQSLSLDRGKKQFSNKINPYSSEGLDKFEKLLAELAEKKKQVLLRKGYNNDDGDDSVRFRYNSDTGDWVPTIVKKPAETKKKVRVPKEKEVVKQHVGNKVVINKRSRWNAHSHCWLIALLLLLLLLSCFMFGRAFVVCSATIVWYLVPNWNLKRLSTDPKWLGRNYLRVNAPAYSSSMN
ncbi:uncharacterized protein M6B38_176115 [Iris pallida]|uniref:ZCF37 n=1 Tax=Iris pallida TaxID=29817 RepID=A0AAX6ER06_IRIPA|nr:uncharacterized protein M6B38_176115 [Iris pallida]